MTAEIPPPRVFLIGVAALLLALAGHWYMHLGYIDRLNTTNVPPDPPRRIVEVGLVHPATAARLHIVLIDGLGYDHAMTLPAVRALASEGVSRVLMADFPSFTDPNVRAMATGRPPLWSGVRINGLAPYPAWDTITRRAEESGIVVRADDADYPRLTGLLELSPTTTFATTKVLLAAPQPARALDVFYFGLVDDVGHDHGGASAEYKEAAVLADAFLARVVAGVDRGTDAIFVLSDHGHMPEGGHGGAEPDVRRALFVASGHGVAKAGPLPPAAMRDVASTLAASLAIPAPKDAIGEPMLDVLADGEGRALASPHDDAHAKELDLRMDRDFEARARTRILLTGAAAALLAALGAWWLGKSELRLRPRDALPALAHALVFGTAYALMGYRISWSIKRSEIVFEVHTLLFGVMAALVAMKLGKLERRVEEALVTTVLYGVAMALEVAWIGLDTRWLAGPRASFFCFILMTCHFYVGVASAFAVFRPVLTRPRFAGAVVGTVCFVVAPVLYRLVR